MKFVKNMTLVLALGISFSANASGIDWGSLLGGLLNSSANGSSNGGGWGDIGGILQGGNAEDILFNAAYLYASSNPEYAVILDALNIHSGADLEKLLLGEGNGSNFQDIVSHLAANYAAGHPEFQQWLNQLGISNEAQLKTYMNGKGSKYQSTFNKMAFLQASNNKDYQDWMSELGINDVSDIQNLLNGDGGNIFANLLPLAEQYIQANYPQYAQFLPLLEQLLGQGSSDGSIVIDDPNGDIPSPEALKGSFAGLPSREVKAIRAAHITKSNGIFDIFHWN